MYYQEYSLIGKQSPALTSWGTLVAARYQSHAQSAAAAAAAAAAAEGPLTKETIVAFLPSIDDASEYMAVRKLSNHRLASNVLTFR